MLVGSGYLPTLFNVRHYMTANVCVVQMEVEEWSGLAKDGKPVEVWAEELARPLVEARGLDLVGVELVKEGHGRFLRVYIDKEGGVNFDDCESVSRMIDARLDEILPNPPYEYFEVSSPGLERPLKRDTDFARYKGHRVAVSTYGPVDGQKLFVGELIGLINDSVVIRLTEGMTQGQEVALERHKISGVRLRVDF